jgi:hypothetical protein
MTTICIITSVVLYGLSVLCEWAERKSRRWYSDPMLLRLSGFFFALATVAMAVGVSL